MSDELRRISASLEKTQAILGATNLALGALVSLLGKEQFEELMQRFAKASAVQQDAFERSKNPVEEAQVNLMQKAEEVLAAALREGYLHQNRR